MRVGSVLTRAAASIALFSMLLTASVLVPPVFAEGQAQSADKGLQDVTVDLVYSKITDDSLAECLTGNALPNIPSTLPGEDESHTVTQLTYEVNGTTFEVTIENTLLWSYEELTDEVHRTAGFASTEIIAEDTSTQFYSLSYNVQHTEYDLTVTTALTPLNSETYNSSFTIMSYAPAGKPEVTSVAFVEFNSVVTLSQLYAILGEVAKDIGKGYEKSGNETLAQLAQGHYVMEEEGKRLAKLVEKQLEQYNNIILESQAIVEDPRVLVCIFGLPFVQIVFYCLDPLAAQWRIVAQCCGPLYALTILATAACLAPPWITCLAAIAAAIIFGIATLSACIGLCPSMQACVRLCFLWWCWEPVCLDVW